MKMSHAVEATLRSVIAEVRAAHPGLRRSIYTMDEMAQASGLAKGTVKRIYDHLRDEGLLVTERSQGTFVEAVNGDRAACVRGFVGLPVAWGAYTTVFEYQLFANTLIQTLREHRFAAFLCPYLEGDPDFPARLLRQKMDAAVWCESPRKHDETLCLLRDRGLRVVTLGRRERSMSGSHYMLSRARALQAAIDAWRAAGAKKILVVRSTPHAAARRSVELESLLREADIACDTLVACDANPAAFCTSIGRKKADVLVILESGLAAKFASRAPEQFFALLAQQQTLLCGGLVASPFFAVPPVRAGLVRFDWQSIAERMLLEITNSVQPREPATDCFHAAFLPDQVLNEHPRGWPR